MKRHLPPDIFAQRQKLALQVGAVRAMAQVSLGSCGLGRRKLPVHAGLNQQSHVRAVGPAHRTTPWSWVRISAWRARQSRDMTVPIGTPVIWATCLYESAS